MKNIKKSKIFKYAIGITSIVILLFLLNSNVLGNFNDNQLIRGTENLLNTVKNWIIGIGITVSIVYFIYYVILLNTSDEGDRRRSIKNVKTTLIAVILITCGVRNYRFNSRVL